MLDLARGFSEPSLANFRSRLNVNRLLMFVLWPLLFRSISHTIPALAVHFSVEEIETGFTDVL